MLQPRTSAFLLVLLSSLAFQDAQAAGELMVHPTRLVFEGSKRAAQVDLINSGTEPMTYRITLVRKRMTETGEFVTVDSPLPDEKFADELIRYSPRQVTLQPRVAQSVRLQLRKPGNLEPGEYRSHLLFQALPPPNESGIDTAAAGESSNEFRIELVPVYSVSIPVIVRHGETAATAKIADLRLRSASTLNQPALVAFELQRSGTRSVYGDLAVYFTPAGGNERVLGRANGVAVYSPNRVRRVQMPLHQPLPPGARGLLRVTFSARPEEGGKVLAEERITVP